ncbi:MAG: hypothetical protein KC766_12950, partial [Myxococcales bacterium]|nr:hypothetical protein [Myxococcales bacterium]
MTFSMFLAACGSSSIPEFNGSAGEGGGGPLPTSCRSDKDCTPHGLLCDLASNRCVECFTEAECE